MRGLIDRQDAINAMMALQAEDDEAYGCHIPEGFDGERAKEALEALPSAQPEHTSNNDCNGCKFVGCYDTDFPCANCIRKNKDYYAPERRTDE